MLLILLPDRSGGVLGCQQALSLAALGSAHVGIRKKGRKEDHASPNIATGPILPCNIDSSHDVATSV